MKLSPLTAITPIDGRYFNKISNLKDYFSEYALIKYRIQVEIEYFIALCNAPIKQLENFPIEKFSNLRAIYINFNEINAQKVKKIESTTNWKWLGYISKIDLHSLPPPALGHTAGAKLV